MNAITTSLHQLATKPVAMLTGERRPDLVRDEVLAELFAETVRRYPARIAMSDANRQLTYAQVWARASVIARGLSRCEVGPGDVVGLWMPRGIDLLIAQIAITLSGAAWLPFDSEAPVDRIAVCLKDASAKGLITAPCLLDKVREAAPSVWTANALAALDDGVAMPARAPGLRNDHPAYLIYTSGSTGVPKGIEVSHANICHFLRSANELYGLTETDVMFQGASLAFDLSMEEVWTPYLVGAALYVATPDVMADVEALPGVMEAAGVTVLDTVPTLLGLLPRDVATLRLILLGGEALPPAVVERWAKPGRRMLNTYGPTEATVVATACEVERGQPVTIGRPIANYTCYIVDEGMNLLGAGEEGELLIGGPGVVPGYFGRADLTQAKFIANPFAAQMGSAHDPVLYRSGDAVSLDAKGDIAFHGRIDDQVKIRGFRVELGEIESRLGIEPEVAQAAVILRAENGVDQLVGFIVAQPGHVPDAATLRQRLRANLPPYMVPSHIETVAELPRLISGKTDRKALKAMPLTVAANAGEQEAPRNAIEATLLAAAKRALGDHPIAFEADFFLDLGGHSLTAARFVSTVRETPAYASLTLQEVYGARSLRAMAELLAPRAQGEALDLSFTPPSLAKRFWCGLAQAAAMPFLLALSTVQWLGIFITYLMIADEDIALPVQILIMFGIYAVIRIAIIAIAIIGKWSILGRTRPGTYPLWGAYYYRWWVASHLMALVPHKWFQGTPLMNAYMRALGARVGKDAIVSDFDAGAIDLIEIGDGAVLGSKTKFANAEGIGANLVIGPISIGKDAVVGTSCVISHDVVIGERAELLDLTALHAGTQVAAGEIWDGSPGRLTGMVDEAAQPQRTDATGSRRVGLVLYYLAMLLALPSVTLLPIFPAFWFFDQIDESIRAATSISPYYFLPLVTWPTAMAMIAFTVMLVAALRWLMMRRLKAGSHSVFSNTYAAKWTVSLTNEVTLDTLSSLFATIYMRQWYRLMGARIGKGSELSTNLSGRFDLTQIGGGNFIADEVLLGDEEIRRGVMTLEPVVTGERVFVGNDAVVAPGSVIPDGVLIGIKSKPPANELMQEGDTWFGSPPIKLPTRQRVDLGAAATFEPPLHMRIGRGVFEAFHTSFPAMLFITFGTIAVDLFIYDQIKEGDWLGVIGMFIACGVAIAMAQTLVCAAMKWLLMGVYRATMKPMWSWWAMRTEAIAVLYWGLGGKVLLDHLRGTPFLPWSLRLFGAKFGQGVWMNMTDITEFDCVKVGDFCTLNAMSALQTHLYEDRVMKVGQVTLGRGVSVGAGSTVLYDTHIGDYVQLGPLTVVMKGESMPAHTAWEGAPARVAA